MRQIKIYRTKAKWRAYLDASGLPCTGYDRDCERDGEGLVSGENVLIHGTLLLTGTSRGRSAAHFDLAAVSGWKTHMTMKGTERLFHAVALGQMTMQMDTWRYGGEDNSVPSFRGYWTLVKQGTEYSIIPAPSDLFPWQ